MSSNTSTSIATLRDIIASSGYSYRVNDDDLRSIAQSPNPRETCERIVRNLGGSPRDFSNLIDRVVAAVQAPTQGTPQDSAPAPTEGFDMEEAADILRTGAARLGAKSSDVEALLIEAGLVKPAPEPEDEDEDEVASEIDQDSVNRAILSTLKKMNKRLKDIKSVL
jgi:hypothetical protein